MTLESLPYLLDVFIDGEFVGVADCIIHDDFGSWYGGDGEKLQDNGEYLPLGGFGVEVVPVDSHD